MENRVDTSELNRPAVQGRRLWYAIGAGGLLLVIMGGLVAWLPWQRQVQAITEIERLGGYVETVPVGPGWLQSIVGDEVMLGYDHVQHVFLENTQVNDAGLVHLKGLKTLQTLSLSPQVTDAGLVHITELTTLQALGLSPQVTDAGLVHLKGLKKLHYLNLCGTQVTDAGLEHLQTALPTCVIEK